MVGKLKIEELRARSKAALGAKYDDRGFHDTVLLAGSMPLDMLERARRRVDRRRQRIEVAHNPRVERLA